MHEKTYVKWVCDYCGKEFDVKFHCRMHEREEHKCEICEHSYLVYGCELECERQNKGKKCSFKMKKEYEDRNP
jgi:hypothetical protein